MFQGAANELTWYWFTLLEAKGIYLKQGCSFCPVFIWRGSRDAARKISLVPAVTDRFSD